MLSTKILFCVLFQWHFIVMQSIFWPTLGIGQRYDVKGCLKGRYQVSISPTLLRKVQMRWQSFFGTLISFTNKITLNFRYQYAGLENALNSYALLSTLCASRISIRRVKTAGRMLMKLTPGVNFINVPQKAFA